MSISFREYVILLDALTEDGRIDEGAIWDKIQSLAKGTQKSKDDLEKERDQLVKKYVQDPKAEENIRKALQNKSMDLQTAAKLRAEIRQKKNSTSSFSSSKAKSDPLEKDRATVNTAASLAARRETAARRNDQFSFAEELKTLEEGRQDYEITYKAKSGGRVMRDVICAKDARDVRQKFSNDYHGMRLLTIAPKKASVKSETEEYDLNEE